MKKIIIICIAIFTTAFSLFSIASAQTILFPSRGGTGLGSATAGDVGLCLKVLDDSPFTYELGSCGSGGGGGGGTFSTTTSQVVGQLINYPNNATDIVAIGSNSTTTSEFWFNPNTGITYLSGNVGIGTTSPYAKLSVVGEVVAPYYTATSTTATSTFAGKIQMLNTGSHPQIVGWDNDTGIHFDGPDIMSLHTGGVQRLLINALGYVGVGTSSPYAPLSVVGQVVGSHFTSTTTNTNTLPNASITKLVNLTSNGFVKTSGGDGTLSIDTATYESGLTAGDGLTRTGNDFDFDGGATPGGSLGGTWASPTIDDLFLLNTGDTGTGLYTLSYASTTGFSTAYASSTEWRGGGLVSDCTGASNKITWNSTTGQFACEADVAGSGGTGLATSTPIVDTYVIYGTSASTVGAEAAFNYDDATDTLSVGVLTLTTDLSVANGGTGLSTFGGTNTLLYTTTADNLSSEAALTYNPTTNLLTTTNASTTLLTALTGLWIPSATDPVVDSAGRTAVNTTTASSSLRFYDSAERALYPEKDRTAVFASSTLAYIGGYGATGTTTIIAGAGLRPETITQQYCFTDTGTALIQIGDGSASTTNSVTYVACSTTGGSFSPTSNNAFTMREKKLIGIGSITGTPNQITLTYTARIDAD